MPRCNELNAIIITLLANTWMLQWVSACVCVCVCSDAQTAMYNAYTTDLLMTKLFIWWRRNWNARGSPSFSSLTCMPALCSGCSGGRRDVWIRMLLIVRRASLLKWTKKKQLMPTVYKTINNFLPGWLWCSEKAQVSLWMWRYLTERDLFTLRPWVYGFELCCWRCYLTSA